MFGEEEFHNKVIKMSGKDEIVLKNQSPDDDNELNDLLSSKYIKFLFYLHKNDVTFYINWTLKLKLFSF